MTQTTCAHATQTPAEVAPQAQGCVDCLKIGQEWELLRLCLSCGYVGCCDTSKGKHATKHFQDTGHPIAKLLERPEDTDWCYVDQIYVKR